MKFDKHGRLVINTCICGVAELDDILSDSSYIKASLGDRDIVYFPSVISKRCAKKYVGVGGMMNNNLTREDCLSYQG